MNIQCDHTNLKKLSHKLSKQVIIVILETNRINNDQNQAQKIPWDKEKIQQKGESRAQSSHLK